MALTQRKPDYRRFLKVLQREPMDEVVAFEGHIDWPVVFELLGEDRAEQDNPKWGWCWNAMAAKAALGCDVSIIGLGHLTGYRFETQIQDKERSISQNEGGVIVDDESFEKYEWPDIEKYASDFLYYLDEVKKGSPDGMKVLLTPPRGVFESLVDLMGFEEMCFGFMENPELMRKLTDKIGQQIYRFYEISVRHDFVCATHMSDDWGYKTSLMISPDLMREYIFPWHKKCVQLAHDAGKPAVLHSCGNIEVIMDDIIEDMKYDGLHSFEDVIEPVESVYERYGDRIAILGGMDLDYLHSATPDEIKARCGALTEKAKIKGGYALGSGNSIMESLPKENYMALFSMVK